MRKNRIEIRLSEDEVNKLHMMRGAMRLRTFIRYAALDSAPPTIPEINRSAMSALQRIGGNLNQIARHANATGGDIDLTALRAQVSALRATLAGAVK